MNEKELEKIEDWETETEALIRRERRRQAVGLDSMCDWDFEHDNGENPLLTDTGKNYVTHFAELQKKGMGIMYFGALGSGKSYAAAQITNALTDAGYRCLFTSFRKILTDLGTLSNEGKQDYLKQLYTKDLLVFDEYGSEEESVYNNQIILQIISMCYHKHIPMLVTTCYHRESLVKSCSTLRLLALTRLWQRCCCIQVNTPLSRRNEIQNQLNQEEELLKGSGPYKEVPEEQYSEPCQEEREAVLQKEFEEKEAKKQQRRKQKNKTEQPQAAVATKQEETKPEETEQEETNRAGKNTPAEH